MRPIVTAIAAGTLAVTALAGCPSREVSEVGIVQQKQQKKQIDVELKRDLDILFVIDNSDSMGEEQASLAANFPAFIDKLQNIEGGLPNVHIGVVTTDVGAGNVNDLCSTATSDKGELQADLHLEDGEACAGLALGLDDTRTSSTRSATPRATRTTA